MVRRSRQNSYSDLRFFIEQSLENSSGFGSRVEIDGKLNRIADGLWHDNYWFWIRGRGLTPAQAEQAYVLRILKHGEEWQRGPEPRERLLREAETLQVLSRSNFSHPTPRFITFVEDADSQCVGMIETGLSGYSLGSYRDRSTLRHVSRVAADVHRFDINDFSHLPSSDNRKAHIELRFAELDESLCAEFHLAGDICRWIADYIPAVDSCCVLHGDLLPQNLLSEWPSAEQQDAPVAVVDWEMAQVWEPAYELAIVSRGDRKVLGVKNGLKVFVEEYLDCGGQPVSVDDVRVHEFLLLLNWLEESWREYQKPVPRGHGPDYYEAKLLSLFRSTIG